MASQTYPAFQGAADTIVQNSNLQGIAFSQRALAASIISDPYGRLEGEEGSNAGIITRRGLVGKGIQVVKIPISGVLGAGVRRGETELSGAEEPVPMNSVSVTAGVRRHATSYGEQFAEFIAAGGDVNSKRAKLLGHHFGWMKAHEAGLKLRNGARPGVNVFFANNKTSIETLRGADVITYAEVVKAHHWADEEAHITPMNLNAIAGNKAGDVSKLLLFGPKRCFTQLKIDSNYLSIAQNADIRGIGKNVLFTGQFADLDNLAFHAYETISPHETNGLIGCPLAPRVRLSQSPGQTATSAIDVLNSAGSHTNIVLYSSRGVDSGGLATNNTIFENFSLLPAHLYHYDAANISAGSTTAGESLFGVAATDRFALIYDPSDGGSTMIHYVAADFGTRGNTLTVDRLTSSNTTLTGGNVTYNTGIWSGYHKSTGFMPGSFLIPCNSYGQAFCMPIVMGSGALARVYGKEFRDISDTADYDEVHGQGYRTVFGSSVIPSAYGMPRGYVQIVAALSTLGLNLPTVV